MRLGTRSLWLLLALLVAATGRAQSDDASAGPDGLKTLARYWKDRRGGDEGRGPVIEGNTIRAKPGQLIKLTPEADWPAEVEWDWPETLVSREDTDRYHIDDAKRTLILPSDRPGQYRVTAWGSDKGGGRLLPEAPAMPRAGPGKPAATPAAPGGKPRRLKVWTVIVEGGTPPVAKPPGDRTEKPSTAPADILAAVKEDLKDPANKAALADLQAAFEKLAREAESGTRWKFSGDANKEINGVMKAVPPGKLPQTVKAVGSRLKQDQVLKTLSGPATPWTLRKPRETYAKVLREIANALK